MKRMCVLVPTMNRPDCMKEVLNSAKAQVQDFPVDIWIYDTSTNEDTKNACEAANQGAARKFVYYQKFENYPDKTTDLKVSWALRDLTAQYDYIWLSGDGCLLQIQQMLPRIAAYLDQDFDVIHFTGKQKNNQKKKVQVYTSAVNFFRDHAGFLTYYSSTIVSSAFFSKFRWQETAERFRNTGFMFWELVFEGLSQISPKMVAFDTLYMIVNPKKNGNSSTRPARFLNFWVTNWYDAVHSLPALYDPYKDEVCKQLGNSQGFYAWPNLIALRESRNLDKKLYAQYQNEFSKVTDAPLWRIRLVAQIPKPFLALIKAASKAKSRINNFGKEC